MIVRELIYELKKLPPDMEVVMESHDDTTSKIEDIKQGYVETFEKYRGTFFFGDYGGRRDSAEDHPSVSMDSPKWVAVVRS